jgi:hypothetical protein
VHHPNLHPKRYFREYWASPDSERLRLRVNDRDVSLHPEFGGRSEATANGLALIDVPDDLRSVAAAELVLELWGGHPWTTHKRVTLNGHHTYCLPADGTDLGHCAYTFPRIPVGVGDLVRGTNVLQFACDRGRGFWGHYIVDNVCLRLYYHDLPEMAHEGLAASGGGAAHCDLSQESVARRFPAAGPAITDTLGLSIRFDGGVYLEVAPACDESLGRRNAEERAADVLPSIGRVDYYARYSGYAALGGISPISFSYHGGTKDRFAYGHLGGSTEPPFAVGPVLARALPQPVPVSLAAVATTIDGGAVVLGHASAVLRRRSDEGVLAMPYESSVPFWSRAGKAKTARLDVPADLAARITSAHLRLRLWNGGAGSVEHPVRLNGEPVDCGISGAPHDLVDVDVPLRDGLVQAGTNVLTVRSNTEHHGIEVLLPGPALEIRYEYQ